VSELVSSCNQEKTMRNHRIVLTLASIAVAAALSIGFGSRADAAPARPYQSFDLGNAFAVGDNCVGKAMGGINVSPGRGTAWVSGGWFAWTPKVLGPCSNVVTIAWYNFATHRSGKLVRRLTDRGMFSYDNSIGATLRVGSGPVRFRLGIGGRLLTAPPKPVTVIMP